MSTATKRPHADAAKDAGDFRALFDGCYEKWAFGGSLRRNRPEVADTEHVIIPRWADVPGDGLFGEPVRTNLLIARSDALVADGSLAKHFYGATGPRWGPLHRGMDFRGHMHELYSANAVNYGAQLAIRTGSAEFSQRLVTGLRRNGRRNKDGYVWACRACELPHEGDGKGCPECQGTRLVPVDKLPAATEEAYFELCGFRWIAPENRN